MRQHTHAEGHFGQSQLVKDAVLGAADGLTVPFALAAGLAGAVASTRIVVTAGLAEITAGAIAMGLGGYLAARSEVDHYRAEYRRESQEVAEVPERERAEVAEVLGTYGLSGDNLERMLDAISAEPKRWVDFMMRFELGLEEPDAGTARKSAWTIGGAYLLGGFIPLLPYMIVKSISQALIFSVIGTLIALFGFGALKGKFTGSGALRSGTETLLVGGAAAAVAFAVARLVSP
jgi:VIT1/CCC1 family predicted Fe2+/Mn2+ transporter